MNSIPKDKIKTLLMNQRIGVLGGGFDGEREVSLRSAANVLKALQTKGLPNVFFIDVNFQLLEQLSIQKPQRLYNALHGAFGEDGRLQGLLDFMKIPYTGEFFLQSAFAFDKILTKTLFSSLKIPTPMQYLLLPDLSLEEQWEAIPSNFHFPMVLKQSLSGSSLGVFIVENKEALFDCYEKLSSKEGLYIEAYVQGREITVGVIRYNNRVQVLPILGIQPMNAFYDYEAKYTKGKTSFEIPATLAPSLRHEIECLCLEAFKRMGFRQCVRFDFVIDPENRPYALEVNTSSGLTETSDIPLMLKVAGIDAGDFFMDNLYHATYKDLGGTGD